MSTFYHYIQMFLYVFGINEKYFILAYSEPFNQEASVSVCKLPKDFGTCLTVSIRFFHDSESGACKKFRYSGCGGNGNNFLSGEACVRTCGGLLTIDKRLPKLPTIDLAPNPPTGNGGRKNVVNSLPALSSTPNAGSGVSIVAITPRTPRSTTTTSTTTIGIASTERPIFNVNTILPNVIDDSREIKEEVRSLPLINRNKQTNNVRVRQRKVRVRQRKKPSQDTTGTLLCLFRSVVGKRKLQLFWTCYVINLTMFDCRKRGKGVDYRSNYC